MISWAFSCEMNVYECLEFDYEEKNVSYALERNFCFRCCFCCCIKKKVKKNIPFDDITSAKFSKDCNKAVITLTKIDGVKITFGETIPVHAADEAVKEFAEYLLKTRGNSGTLPPEQQTTIVVTFPPPQQNNQLQHIEPLQNQQQPIQTNLGMMNQVPTYFYQPGFEVNNQINEIPLNQENKSSSQQNVSIPVNELPTKK